MSLRPFLPVLISPEDRLANAVGVMESRGRGGLADKKSTSGEKFNGKAAGARLAERVAVLRALRRNDLPESYGGG